MFRERVDPIPATGDLSTILRGQLHVGLDLLEMVARDDRTEIALWTRGVPDPESAHPRQETIHELASRVRWTRIRDPHRQISP